MAETNQASAGVQSLIDRIRDQGVQAAQSEADRILEQAREQAAQLLAAARTEADSTLVKAKAEIEVHRTASMEALQLAARDTVLDLKTRVSSRFEEFVKRLVTSATRDKELIRSIVLVLAGRAASEFIKDKSIEVRVSQSLFDDNAKPVFDKEGRLAILGLTSDMLREGLELAPDSKIEGGARVRLVKEKLEIDLSDKVVAKMISQRLLPRFRAILNGAE